MLDLKELKFKIEDFNYITTDPDGDGYVKMVDKELSKLVVSEANRLLRERLGRATEVRGIFDGNIYGIPHTFYVIHSEGLPTATHVARLVCIEEIK
jgi:hypothetical protein